MSSSMQKGAYLFDMLNPTSLWHFSLPGKSLEFKKLYLFNKDIEKLRSEEFYFRYGWLIASKCLFLFVTYS